jgi:hypothetical protein
LRDPVIAKREVLSNVLASSLIFLEEASRNADKIRSIRNWAKNPKERTAINIILDDQKKVVKALQRLIADMEEYT